MVHQRAHRSRLDELDRFVIDVDKTPPLDADGFLEVPPADAWWVLGDTRPRPASELAGATTSFVLLAAAGAGKSTVLNALQSLEPGAVEIDLRVDPTGAFEALRDAAGRGVPIYFDALDEAAIYHPNVFRILERLLTLPEATLTSWRLACRPAAWTAELARDLEDRLAGFRQLRLLPLHRGATRQIAVGVGADPEAFLAALSRARLGRLSATPRRLHAAAEQWSATGRLPENAVESMQFELNHLLPEPDPLRPQAIIGHDRQLRIARRLGAIAIFCSTPRFRMADSGGHGTIAVADLPSRPDPDEPGNVILPDDYRHVLSTALFDPAPGSSVVFRHQQYAEYLAAAYLVERSIGRRLVRSLLGVGPDDLLPGTMAGVAAWLTALDAQMTAELLAANPLQLARAGLEIPSDEARAAVTAGLLARAAIGDLDPEWGLDLQPLAHPRLAEQIDQSLAGPIEHPGHLWWVAKLSTAGRYREPVEPLLQLTLEARWPAWARGAGIEAIRQLGDREHLEQLRSILYLSEEEDPDDELLADAIEAVYPDLLTTRELLAALRPRRNDHLIGGYLLLLGNLVDKIPEGDLPLALDWLAERAGDWEDSYGRLPGELVKRAWEQSGAQPVLRALASVLHQTARTPARFDLVRRNAPPWVNAAADERRRLAVAVAEALDAAEGWLDVLDLRLVTAEDALWLVETLPHLPARSQPALATCLPHLIHEPSAELADRIFNLPPDHPAHESTEHLRTPLPLDSEVGVRWRRAHAMEVEDRNNEITPERNRELLVDALAEAERDSEQWWKAVYWLSVEHGRSVGDALFSHDLTRRPGWSLLDDRERERFIAVGLDSIRIRELEPHHWRGQNRIQIPSAMRDWAGVYLLTTLARHDPERVRQLDRSVWPRIAPAIAGAWNHEHDDAELRAELVRLAPGEGRRSIGEAALEQLDADARGGRPLSQYPVYRELINDLAQPLSDRLVDGRYSQPVAGEVLDLLVEHSPAIGVAACRALRSLTHTELVPRAARHLARLDGTAVLDELLDSRPPTQEVLDVVPHLDFTGFETRDLTRLASLLLDRLPFAEDPPTPAGAFRSDAAFEARRVRGRVLDLLADRGEVTALEELAAAREGSDLVILRRLTRHARSRAVELAFTPVSPDQLLALLARGDARLVRSDSDLLNVVLEHLMALQDELRHGTSFRDLWNDHPDGTSSPKQEDDISDWLRRNLQARLAGGTIIDREVHVSRPAAGGIGTRVDLAATTTTNTQPADVARVTIEAKLINHPELATALTDQLAHRYLAPMGRRSGIYLVYWINGDQRPAQWRRPGPDDQRAVQEMLKGQAARLRPDFEIRPFILDISLTAA